MGPAARAGEGALGRAEALDGRGEAGGDEPLAAVAAEGEPGPVLGAAARALGALTDVGGGGDAVRGVVAAAAAIAAVSSASVSRGGSGGAAYASASDGGWAGGSHAASS